MRFSRSLSHLLLLVVVSSLCLATAQGWAQSAPVSPGAATPLPDPAPNAATGQDIPPAPPPDTPLDSQTVVRLSDVEGSVRLSDATGKLFDQVLQNMAVLPGMSVETGNDGRAELEFPDGSVARVTPNSKLALAEVTQDATGRAHLVLTPAAGLTYFELAPEGERIEVGPLTALAARGSAEPVLLRVNLDAMPYQAAVLRGTVHFEDATGDAAYDLETGQTAKIDPQAATNYDISLDLVPDTWDTWNADRDSLRSQIAGASRPEGENAGPGWNDLNYYGSWYDVPGEGMAWAPDGVGDAFDPYGSGAWGYYTTAGYGWVSSYPWGWLPYHCGVWNHYPRVGWMWRPAGCGWGAGRGWYPYTRVRNAPARYLQPTRPQPPHGIHQHPPQSLALLPVHQGPAVHFRVVGQPRPAPRTLTVADQPLLPLPAASRPSYRSIVPAGDLAPAPQGSLFPGGQPGYLTRSTRAVPPSSGYMPVAPRTVQPHAPVYLPPPRSAAAPSPVAAPHVAAPAAPAAGGHVH